MEWKNLKLQIGLHFLISDTELNIYWDGIVK